VRKENGIYDSVEFTAFIALRSSQVVLGLTGAELAEIFSGFGDGISKELEFYAAEGFS
jgi:hypothetical protein